jgi:tRNA G18 (ribose-2'-O)-methylase SpoU
MSEKSSEVSKADGKAAREEKKRKWEAKQQEKELAVNRKRKRERWCEEHSQYTTFVAEDIIAQVLGSEDIHGVPSLLQPYLNLREGSQTSDDDSSAYFIAEGTETIRLLIQQSRKKNPLKIHVNSIVVKPSVLFDEPVNLLQDLERIALQRDSNDDSTQASRSPFHVFVAEEHIMSKLAGFRIARGALACGVVPQHRNSEWLMNYLLELRKGDDSARPIRLLAFDGISDTANLGSIIRTASAFGIVAAVLSQDCCDAWYRRSVRVSMGHIFRVPCIRVDELAAFLKKLKSGPLGVISYAAVIDPASDLRLETMEKGKEVVYLCCINTCCSPPWHVHSEGSVGRAWCCVVGNESKGISETVRSACSHSIRIEMEADVDSLSVPVATGILLHGLKEREPKLR